MSLALSDWLRDDHRSCAIDYVERTGQFWIILSDEECQRYRGHGDSIARAFRDAERKRAAAIRRGIEQEEHDEREMGKGVGT